MKTQTVGTVTRSMLAKMYGVKLDLLNSWIKINPELRALYDPYIKKRMRALPPVVMHKTFAILGNPE